MAIDFTGLSNAQIDGLKSLSGRKTREDYLTVIVNHLKLHKGSPQEARKYFLAESAKIPNFGRDFLGVDGLNDGVECYSPNINRFLLINPYGESKIAPKEFKIFLRSGATSEWDDVPDEDGFTNVGEKLSTIDDPMTYFPGFKCIDKETDSKLRKYYTDLGFDITRGMD